MKGKKYFFYILLWSTPFQKDQLLVFFKFTGSIIVYISASSIWNGRGTDCYSLFLWYYIIIYIQYTKMPKKFSECEFHLMRSFSCHADRINRGMTVISRLIVHSVVWIQTMAKSKGMDQKFLKKKRIRKYIIISHIHSSSAQYRRNVTMEQKISEFCVRIW